ncbi:MAG: FAD-dependent oxidoreductase [Thiomargarita sp.]|nr:FAD-dependent oxidoreductase [Thiomargarita sp.]
MKSLFSPLKALSFLGRQPVTLPIEPRPAAPNYRGFHLNDWETCIGCGTCATICDNAAIRMVNITDLPSDPIKGFKAQRPAIDYGRCCWCALCVDICPTGALSLSREYVHVSLDLNTYFILPDNNGMHNLGFEKGWAKSSDSDLLDLKRKDMPELKAKERHSSFVEIVQGFDEKTAVLEASRCVQCGMCHDACPTNMHAPEYIRAIWEGNIEEAVRQIYRTNPLANICGRVCTHRCETACAIGQRGDPISIRWLKRYAMDTLSPERIKEIASEGKNTEKTHKKIAIVGAGAAGLTCAFDLAYQGHAVTIFEAFEKPGGMMRYGIPEYRLPYDKLDEDIEVITSLGVDIRCNVRIGKDITVTDLEQDYDATLISIGLHQGRSTRIPNSDHAQVYSSVALLRRITLQENIDISSKIAVIGGGNVAFDIARSLARLQRQQWGAVNIIVCALEAREHMLADDIEVIEALEEGITLLTSQGPKECKVVNGKLVGLTTIACVSIFDEQGRFHPKYDENTLITHEVNMVIEAIGQAPQLECLGDALTERLEWDKRGRPVINTDGGTSESWLWAAGDVVEGPDVIHGIAAGHRVANSIHQYLSR